MADFLKYVPVIICVAFPATFLISYVWACLNKDVYPLLPSVSDTGTIPPESCLFSMMLNLIAASLLFTLYIRHKEAIEVFRAKKFKSTIPSPFTLNTITTCFGVVACIGLDLVANFQETNVLPVHGIGALICFWSSAIYIILQTIITFWLAPEINGLLMVIVRGFLGFCTVIFTASSMVTANIAIGILADKEANVTTFLKWSPEWRGWEWHVASTGCEWILVLTLALYILTYYWDFKKITLEAPELIVANKEEVNEIEEAEKLQTVNAENPEERNLASEEV